VLRALTCAAVCILAVCILVAGCSHGGEARGTPDAVYAVGMRQVEFIDRASDVGERHLANRRHGP
jgi:hypothetical protein